MLTYDDWMRNETSVVRAVYIEPQDTQFWSVSNTIHHIYHAGSFPKNLGGNEKDGRGWLLRRRGDWALSSTLSRKVTLVTFSLTFVDMAPTTLYLSVYMSIESHRRLHSSLHAPAVCGHGSTEAQSLRGEPI